MNFSDLRDAVVVDVETTGLKPEKDRIVSIALIKTDFSAISLSSSGHGNIRTETVHYLFDPEIKIPAAATRVHGITNEKVKGEKKFGHVAQEIRDFIGALPIIAHNMKFDASFLDHEFSRAGVESIARNAQLCTMMEAHRRASRFHGRNVKWPKLTEAAQYAGVEFSQSAVHDALEDAQNALKLAVGLMNTEMNEPGKFVNKFQATAERRPGNALRLSLIIGACVIVVLLLLFAFV